MPAEDVAVGGGAGIGFNRKFTVPGGSGAAGIQLPVATDPAVGLALAQNAPFPRVPLDLAQFAVSAEAGKPIEFGDDVKGKVTFSGGANAFAGLGVFRDGQAILAALPLEDSIEKSIRFQPRKHDNSEQDMFVLMRWGYDLKAAAKGSVALGVGGKATFGVDARTDGLFAVVRQMTDSVGARDAIGHVVTSWALPRQIRDVSDIEPGCWIIAEVDGGIALKLGAEFGYDFNWARQTKLGALKQDIGLRLQTRVNAALGFEASGKYAVVVSRESMESASEKVRLRLFKQSKRGMSFAFNAAATAQVTAKDAPKTVDDFVMAVFDIHPSQLIDDLHAIERWMRSDESIPDALAGLGVDYMLDFIGKVTGVGDVEAAFDEARGRLLGLLAEWDRLPQRVSSTVWKLIEEKVDLGDLRDVTAAIAANAPAAFAKAVEKQLADVDFFRTPVGRWLEAAAVHGVLSVLHDAGAFKELQQVAAATSKVLDPGQLGNVLERLQTELEKRLGLDRVIDIVNKTDFDRIDGWLKKKLSEFLGKTIDFSDLQTIRQAVAELLAKRDKFYDAAVKALTQKYSFSFASTYQKTTTRAALVDAEFDFKTDAAAATRLLAAALNGDFNTLFTDAHPAVKLGQAMLTHEIKRTGHVEVNLPRFSSVTDSLNTAIASVSAVDDDGRILAYDLKASDLVSEKNRRNSRVAVNGQIAVKKGTGVRVHSTESLAYSYAFKQAVRNMKSADLRAQVQPYLEQYFAPLFGNDSTPGTWIADLDKQIDRLEDNGSENFGHTLISLELSLPASVPGAWLQAPAHKSAPAYVDMSRRIQRSLKELIPFYHFADVKKLETLNAAAPLLVYAAILPSTELNLHWDFQSGSRRQAMATHPAAVGRLAVAVDGCHQRLLAAKMDSTAGFYAKNQLEVILEAGLRGDNLHSLLFVEAEIIKKAFEAGTRMAEFRKSKDDDPEHAIEALAEFGAAVTDAFGKKVTSVYGGSALRPLATMIFTEAARAFLPAAAQEVRPSALFELTVVKQAATFDLASFLDGKRPAKSDKHEQNEVVVQERLALL